MFTIIGDGQVTIDGVNLTSSSAYEQGSWDKFRTCAVPQDPFPGQVAYVWHSNQPHLEIPINAFEGRSWLQQVRMEAEDHGAELKLYQGNWYLVWTP